MPKPTAKPVEETVDATAENATVNAQETKERQSNQPWTQVQQRILTKTIKQMRKGDIPGGVTPSSVAKHLATLPEFAGMDIKPVKVSSTLATMRRQREKLIESAPKLAAAGEDVSWLPVLEANPVPEFDRQHSEKLSAPDFAAMLAE